MSALQKTFVLFTLASIALVAAAAEPAAQPQNGSRKFKTSETILLLGVPVPPGSYTLRWSPGAGSDGVKVEIVDGRGSLASATGTWTVSEQPSRDASIAYRRGSAGTKSLAEIRFAGSTHAIRIDADAPRAAGADRLTGS